MMDTETMFNETRRRTIYEGSCTDYGRRTRRKILAKEQKENTKAVFKPD